MRLGIVVLCVASLTSCNKWDGKTMSTAGAGVILDEPLLPYDERNLIHLIATSVPVKPNSSWNDPSVATSGPQISDEPDLAVELGKFSAILYTDDTSLNAVSKQNMLRDARNQVQGRLMARSGNICNAFKQRLKYQSSLVNFGLGTATVLFGSAGAILTGTASQALAAAAGAATGTQSEYNHDILSGITTSVIIPGIDKQRTAIHQEIVNRRCLGVSSYTLTQAILDATRYHAACSTDEGVAAAGSAISQSRTTSLADAKATLDAVAALQATAATIGKDGQAAPAGTGGSGGSTGSNDPGKFDPGKLVLVGSPIRYLQCPSLQSDGLLPKGTDPELSPVSQAAPVAAPRTRPHPVAAPVRGMSKALQLQLPFSGQIPYGDP